MFHTSNYVVPKPDVLPLTKSIVLSEDDDQGEMDIVFGVGLFVYFTYLLCSNYIYEDYVDQLNVAKFHIIMSNLWAFFPIMQAQGLWLKFLLIMTCYFSITWHWNNIGMELPNVTDYYKKMDTVFSIMTIVCYCISWMPRFHTRRYTIEEEKKNCCLRYFRGNPKKTSEWRCRLTTSLVINVFVCSIVGVIIYNNGKFDVELGVCMAFIMIAVLLALYQLKRGIMVVGKKYRKRFIGWASIAILLGMMAFYFKGKTYLNLADALIKHSLWHTFVFSSAYSFSRASEYLDIFY
jgi:hypothetical protein